MRLVTTIGVAVVGVTGNILKSIGGFSSATDTGSGDVSLNWSSDAQLILPSNPYPVQASPSTGTNVNILDIHSTSTSIRLLCYTDAGVAQDPTYYMVSVDDLNGT